MNLASLLRSPPDAISPLNGTALVARKVKLVVWQGGWYAGRHTPADLAKRVPKEEFNWGCGRNWYAPITGCEGEASYAVKHMPSTVEQIFSEIGFLFPTGGALLQCAPQANPCRQALITTLTTWNQNPANGRASWDAVVTLAAVRGVESMGGSKGGLGGTNVVDRGGTNHWEMGDGKSNQSYLVMEGDKPMKELNAEIAAGRPPPILAEMRDEIDRLLCREPVNPAG